MTYVFYAERDSLPTIEKAKIHDRFIPINSIELAHNSAIMRTGLFCFF